jgi:hypothetical protein
MRSSLSKRSSRRICSSWHCSEISSSRSSIRMRSRRCWMARTESGLRAAASVSAATSRSIVLARGAGIIVVRPRRHKCRRTRGRVVQSRPAAASAGSTFRPARRRVAAASSCQASSSPRRTFRASSVGRASLVMLPSIRRRRTKSYSWSAERRSALPRDRASHARRPRSPGSGSTSGAPAPSGALEEGQMLRPEADRALVQQDDLASATGAHDLGSSIGSGRIEHGAGAS